MDRPPVCVAPADLTRFARDLLAAAGASANEAALVAASLVESNLCGHDSHGVMRVLEYVEQMRLGELMPGAELAVRRETASIVVADANFGFGQVQCRRLIDRLLPKAREQGIACGTLTRCGHVGRLGEWVERVARQGLAGLMTVNDNGVLRCVAPPGGTEPRISTNPLAIGVPTACVTPTEAERLAAEIPRCAQNDNSEPLVLDISTSVVANGKVRVAHLAGRPCPDGWLLDAEGNSTTDPATRFADPPGTILPLGGHQAYKGFGLGLLLDILVGGLSGGFCPPAPDEAKASNNVLLVLWNPATFAGQEHFVSQADELIRFVRSSRRREGVEIRLPGDGSAATRRARAGGIPLDQGTWQALARLADELGVGGWDEGVSGWGDPEPPHALTAAGIPPAGEQEWRPPPEAHT
jgi:uncharacterized oxidoreductase